MWGKNTSGQLGLGKSNLFFFHFNKLCSVICVLIHQSYLPIYMFVSIINVFL